MIGGKCLERRVAFCRSTLPEVCKIYIHPVAYQVWTALGSKKRRVHSVAGWIWGKIRRKTAARPCTECQLTVSPSGRVVRVPPPHHLCFIQLPPPYDRTRSLRSGSRSSSVHLMPVKVKGTRLYPSDSLVTGKCAEDGYIRLRLFAGERRVDKSCAFVFKYLAEKMSQARSIGRNCARACGASFGIVHVFVKCLSTWGRGGAPSKHGVMHHLYFYVHLPVDRNFMSWDDSCWDRPSWTSLSYAWGHFFCAWLISPACSAQVPFCREGVPQTSPRAIVRPLRQGSRFLCSVGSLVLACPSSNHVHT